MDAIAYRAGHGMGVQLGTTLVTLNEALFVGTWFLSAFFLLAAGPLALQAGRRALGWSAVGVAAITLVLTADLVRQPRPDGEPPLADLDRRRECRARRSRTGASRRTSFRTFVALH